MRSRDFRSPVASLRYGRATMTPTDADPSITVELTKAEAVAVANVLFMSLRPNNVRPPFDTFAEVQAMETGYQKIATPISDLEGCRCARCGREWSADMTAWDSIGDPETGELELVCEDCITPEEHATIEEHHQRLAKYATQRYATPSWKLGPSRASG
jgi:hypothetical protein